MAGTQGSAGTVTSLALRVAQGVSAVLSYQLVGECLNCCTAVRFAAGLVVVFPWTCLLAILDVLSLCGCCSLGDMEAPFVALSMDMVFSIFSLALASSSAGVLDFLLHNERAHSSCLPSFPGSGRYLLFTALAFLLWILTAATFLFNMWRYCWLRTHAVN